MIIPIRSSDQKLSVDWDLREIRQGWRHRSYQQTVASWWNMIYWLQIDSPKLLGCDWLTSFNKNETRVSVYRELLVWWSNWYDQTFVIMQSLSKFLFYCNTFRTIGLGFEFELSLGFNFNRNSTHVALIATMNRNNLWQCL